MRIWSLHPRHLDRIGLVAGWRETLLAQAVLAGRTKGYTSHPQLQRFRDDAEPLRALGTYLSGLAGEATDRGYRFDTGKILIPGSETARIPVTDAQLSYEWEHLGRKLAQRSPEQAAIWSAGSPTPHPVFRVVNGPIEPWERL